MTTGTGRMYVRNRLNIPKLGTALVLAESWTAHVQGEYRNTDFISRHLGVEDDHDAYLKLMNRRADKTGKRCAYDTVVPIKLPAGTELIVDRI